MADIHFLNQPARANLALARKHLYSCFALVKKGKDKAALRHANRAIAAYEQGMRQSTEARHSFPAKAGVA
jgi:hypothetical protein